MANRGFGTKVGAGFAAVLLILAISSTMAWPAFGEANQALSRYALLLGNSAIFRDIDLTVSRYRGHAREYTYSNSKATADLAVNDAEALRTRITAGLARVTDPGRHALLEDMVKQEQPYTENFTHKRSPMPIAPTKRSSNSTRRRNASVRSCS